MKHYLACLIVAAQLLGAGAAHAAQTVRIGDREVDVSPPPGFKNAADFPPLFTMFQSFVPGTNKLEAGYISDEDYARIADRKEPSMNNYLMVQTVRSYQGDMNEKAFESVKAESKALLPNIEKIDRKSLSEEIEKNLSTRNDMKASLNIGEPKMLGITQETDSKFCYGMMAAFAFEVDGRTETQPMMMSACTMRLRDRLVHSFVYGKYKEKGDIDAVNAIHAAWSDQMLAANGQTAGDSDKTITTAQDGWSMQGMLLGAAIGVGIAMIAGLLLRQRKNRD